MRTTRPAPTACRRGHVYQPGSFALRRQATGYVVRQCLVCKRLTSHDRYVRRTPGYPKRPAALPALRAFLRDELLPWLCPAGAPWRRGEGELLARVRALVEEAAR